jgi:adenylate cyclase, class 2
MLNIEIKAKTTRTEALKKILFEHGATTQGIDYQEDIYFEVPKGRLKLRRGNIENSLIFYERKETAGLKKSEIELLLLDEKTSPNFERILEKSLGIKVKVQKTRQIFWIENIKFHLDEVAELGHFVEIEAIDSDGSIGETELRRQCQFWVEKFDIQPDDFVAASYSDLILKKLSV